MMKKILVAALLLFAALPVMAQSVAPTEAQKRRIGPVATPEQPEAIPLYGDKTPGSRSSENWIGVMGYPVSVRNVTRPTLTPVLPDPAKATGAAVIVAPGGAFMELSWHAEGIAVARALADLGIAAFILKYRLLKTPADEAEARKVMMQRMMAGVRDRTRQPSLQAPESTKDALAALAMIRSRAAEWHVDPAKVGMVGFSAGAMTALNAVQAAPAGKGPNFFGYIYGPQAAVPVRADAPPMFAAIAMDDPLFPAQGFPIVTAWRAAKRPVELHAYERGGHGFGLGYVNTTTAEFMDQFTAWMAMHGFMTKATKR